MAVPKAEMSSGVKWECEQILQQIRERIEEYQAGEKREEDLRSLSDWLSDTLPDLDILLEEDED